MKQLVFNVTYTVSAQGIYIILRFTVSMRYNSCFELTNIAISHLCVKFLNLYCNNASSQATVTVL